MDIAEMKPGRQMNVRVAEDVMGWNMVRRRIYDDVVTEDDYREAAYTDRWIWNTDKGCFSTREWNPSYEIEDAWRVAEKLTTTPHSYEFYLSQQTDGWDVSFQHPGDRGGQAHEDTAPLAICRAALTVMTQPATRGPKCPTEEEGGNGNN